MRFFLAGLFWACLALAAAAGPLHLEKGLVLVYEGFDPGDANRAVAHFERLVRVKDMTDTLVTLEIQFNDSIGPKDKQPPRSVAVDRTMLKSDLQTAHRFIWQNLEGDPDLMPGSLEFIASQAMLSDLNSGTTKLIFGNSPPDDDYGFFGGSSRKWYRGDLKVVEPHTSIEALVNNTPAKLDTIHAEGTFAVADLQISAGFWLLNDADAPIVVRSEYLSGSHKGAVLQLVRADLIVAQPEKKEVASAVETALAGKDCRATLPGIYFGTDSDVLLPASEPALKQVGDVLSAHKDWQLTIEGHTDNVGTDDYNLDLSKRRAASVKQALVSRFGVDEAHLAATGFGESRPVQSNDTPVGRAANRRVDLARGCG